MSASDTPPPLSCAACSKTGAPSYFKITRVTFEGSESPVTVVCSLKCLAQWAYAFASIQGARVVYGVRDVIRQAAELFKPRTD